MAEKHKRMDISPRQFEVLQLVQDGRDSNGYAPTLQEIGDKLGISKVTVFQHAHVLIDKKLLTYVPHVLRSLMPTKAARSEILGVSLLDKLKSQNARLAEACKLARDGFENNWCIDWSILDKALEGQKDLE